MTELADTAGGVVMAEPVCITKDAAPLEVESVH